MNDRPSLAAWVDGVIRALVAKDFWLADYTKVEWVRAHWFSDKAPSLCPFAGDIPSSYGPPDGVAVSHHSSLKLLF